MNPTSILAGVSIVLLACSSGTVVDSPDATLTWAQHRATIPIPDGGLGLVSNNGSDEVSFLDLAANRTMANVRVGIDPIVNDGPHHLAIDPTNHHLFVALSYPPPGVPAGPHAGHGSSLVPGWVQEFDIDDMHEIARFNVDPNPGDIVLTPDHTRILVTHFNLVQAESAIASDAGTIMDAYSNLIILDATNLHRLGSFPVCVMAHGIAVSADGRTAYVACNGQDSLAIVDLTQPDAAHTQVIPVGPGAGSIVSQVVYGPYAVLITSDQQYVVVSDREGRDVRVFNIATHQFEMAHAIRLSGSAFFGAESPDGQFLFVPLQTPDGVARIRIADWHLDMVAPVSSTDCRYPHEISRGPDGRYYLACEAVGADTQRIAPSRVNVLDPNTLTINAHFDVGVYPDRIVFLPGAGQ
jgi:DNA-binding beta-propeller fold protein YncE